MQEEVTQKTIALVIKTAKLDASVLKAAMKMYLNHHKQKAQGAHGKTSVKKLVGDGVGVSSIEVTDGNIKSFERVAKKYNVDFAIKKDKTTEPPKYLVFFKGRDADVVAQAFKEFVYGNEKKKGRVSLREKLKHFKEAVSQDKNRERSREKNKDRGQSL
ncbi:PcfB family protein [Roseburia sp. 1XD42-69]|uniref:PcfB family protein n=1 Tax=Roseburia sp. 1XD42-69 TaxID=2320088 RepID=UPI000EA077C3|nr:PcfB family protein [Roseburia sp. 1XD42-69]RKJ67524.1 PcfB family protein [Roseburia sp. 1XD42-69]